VSPEQRTGQRHKLQNSSNILKNEINSKEKEIVKKKKRKAMDPT
jgi:hypothetical protein